MFDPQQWAEIFRASGAKYVVLTSKHHDGFCLWPSREANTSWGRPWNSSDTGPMRDLLGELTDAVRKNNLEMGFYYSLYEWFNPLYKHDVDLYVDKHMIPQFKDVVERYQPSLIFSDGEWDHPASTWRSAELLAWLFNESSCKDKVVINDRWGMGDRHKHGGYFTTEYGSGLPNADNPWEENRGMAHSFGYSRTENYKDYNTTQALLYMLIDIVSRGGNFLLDIGPTADGRIPVIMQERLIEMGQWLKINGEAIYGTSCWQNTCQWSDGKIPDFSSKRDQSDYNVMRLTVAPDKGQARKEILFTKKEDQLYAICPVYPKDKLIIRNLSLPQDAKVTLLGHSGALSWEQNGDNIEISTPYLTASEVPCQHAWTFKIEGIE
jgi:alpha-L-fucosidase